MEDNKRYNVWCIKKGSEFYHRKYKMVGRTSSGKPKLVDGVEWVSDFHQAS